MEKDKLIDTHKDGIALMRAAMDKYENGEIEDAHGQMTRAFDMISDADAPYTAEIDKEKSEVKPNKPIKVDNVDDDTLYGESRNFGIICKVLKEAIREQLLSKKGKKLIKNMADTIKSDEILKEQYYLYNALGDFVSGNINDYVDELAYSVKACSKKALRESNEKLLKIVKGNSLNEFVDIPDEDITLFEAIDNLFTAKNKIGNIKDYVGAKNIIKEYIGNKQTNANEDERLTEDEQELVEALNDETSDKEKLFYQYKDETMMKLNEMMMSCPDDEKEKMTKIMSTLVESKYNKETVVDDVLKFVTIQETIDE